MEKTTHITPRTAALTLFTLIAFASNSLLCRLALAPGLIDAGTFTCIRLVSGAIVLSLLVAVRDRRGQRFERKWSSALALFAYAAPFSFAYVRIPAGVGALVLFGAVQATMIGWDLIGGKRLRAAEIAGLILALSGLVALTLPGTSAPDIAGVGLMACAGVAWGVYSLKGRGTADPLRSTAGNFLLSLIFALPLGGASIMDGHLTLPGLWYAVASGAVASGLGYALWYTALRGLTATHAGIVQLLVPVFTAIGGVLLLDEAITLRLLLAGTAILAGVLLAVMGRR